MIRYICDRCGEEIEPYSAFIIHIQPPEIKFWGEDFDDSSRHICRDCIRAVVDTMEGKDEK